VFVDGNDLIDSLIVGLDFSDAQSDGVCLAIGMELVTTLVLELGHAL